jgi:beta-fructofuranosidase
MSGGQFLLGDYDIMANKFQVTSGSGHTGIGPPSATIDGNGGVVLIAKVGAYFTLPRIVTLIKDDEVGQIPTEEISSLRYNGVKIENIMLPNKEEVVMDNINGNAMEISAKIDLRNSQMIEMDVLRSPNKEEYTRIIVYKEKGYNYHGLKYISTSETATMPDDLVPFFENEETKQPFVRERIPGYSLISIDTENSSLRPNERFDEPLTLPFKLDSDECLRFRVFIDKSVIEVFVNDRQALCAVVRPDRKDSIGVSIRSVGDDAELISLEAWQMRCIYE